MTYERHVDRSPAGNDELSQQVDSAPQELDVVAKEHVIATDHALATLTHGSPPHVALFITTVQLAVPVQLCVDAGHFSGEQFVPYVPVA